MSPAAERPDWRARIREAARQAAVAPTPSMVAELAAHLDDIYQSTLSDGATVDEARQAAEDALAKASLADLAAEIRRAQRTPRARTTDDLARLHESRSLQIVYALRIAVRQFRHQPLFSLLTVLVLALGTGAAITVYTVVDAVVLRPLPYRAPDRLVALWDTNAQKGLPHEPLSPVTFMDYRSLHAFADAAAWWRPDVNLVDPGLDPVRVNTIETSANLFRLLGVSPQLGPGFPDDGHLFAREPAAVVSARLWRARYHGDPGLVGRALVLNGLSYTIVGVMPDGFDYPGDIDIWERLRWDMTQHVRVAHFMEAVARLAPGVDLSQAQTDGRALASRLGAQFADSNGGWAFEFVPLLDDQLGYYRPALIVMFGAVGVLLLIGCLNVASLLLARAVGRDREMALRAALGATRRQVVVQLLSESAILSAAGLTSGLALAAAAIPIVVSFTPVAIPRLTGVTMTSHVVPFALVVGVLTTVGFGLVPALVLGRRQLGTHLRSGDRAASRGARRIYQSLVIGEVALASALLIGSALLIRTVRQMTHVPSGVRASEVTLTSVQLSGAAYADWQKVADTHAALLARLREAPGITAAGATIRLPFETGWRMGFFLNNQQPAQDTDAPQAQQMSVTTGYFETMGARLVAGRFFTPEDTSKSEGVVVVNEAFAHRYLTDRPATEARLTTYAHAVGPLGMNLLQPSAPHEALVSNRIVGVVGDIPNAALGQPVEPTIYFPDSQFPFGSLFFAIAAPDVPTAVGALRQALHEISPTTPVGPAETWADRFSKRTAEPRVLMATLSAFGGLAAVLAALGVYGLFSWSVASRRRELAIRLTLGARPAAVGAVVLGHGLLLVSAGLVGGWLVIWAAHRPMASLLFETSATDLPSSLGAAAVLAIAALVACLPAARRAMRVDPVEGLRGE